MLTDPEYRQGSLCQTYGHKWRATTAQGKYICAYCQAVGYCPKCLLTVSKDVIRMRCDQHQERQV